MNSWICLILAGFCEIAWAVGLKYTDHFSKLIPSIFTIGSMFLSVLLLNASLKTLPLSLAYAVWTGIGVMGTVIFAVIFFGETLTTIKTVSLLMILLGVLGCKLSL